MDTVVTGAVLGGVDVPGDVPGDVPDGDVLAGDVPAG